MEKSQVHELLCRTRDSMRIVRGISPVENITYASPCFVCLFSKCGSNLAFVDLNGLKVLRTSDYTEILFSRRNNVQLLHFSNCGRYLVTWEKPQEETQNLLMWDLSTGTVIYQFYQKQFMKEYWPTITFNSNSTHFFTKRGDSLSVFRIPDQGPVFVYNEVKVTSYFVSPKTNSLIVYSGDSKGENSKISVFSQEAADLRRTTEIPTKFVQEIKVIWNYDATRALIWCQTDVDTTGRSYYGEHSLYIYTPEPKLKLVKTTEGPIHDVMWNPKENEFVVIAGFMPATSHFYNLGGNKKNEIAKHHRNTIRWNSFGNLFLIAGFGNLQGDVEVYDRSSLEIIGSCRANSTVYCEWGPCGKLFVAATLCPRMRVDNGYCIYKYTGELLIRIMEALELWEVAWTPQIFPQTALTPRDKGKVVIEKKTYVPPGASSGFAARFKSVKENTTGKLQALNQPPPEDYIPGLEPEPAKKKKKKKKKTAVTK